MSVRRLFGALVCLSFLATATSSAEAGIFCHKQKRARACAPAYAYGYPGQPAYPAGPGGGYGYYGADPLTSLSISVGRMERFLSQNYGYRPAAGPNYGAGYSYAGYSY